MKKFRNYILLILVYIFVLTGCGDEEYLCRQGIIYAKEQRPSYTEIVRHSNSYSDYLRTYDDANIIYVKYEEEFGQNNYKTFAFYVSEDIYNQVEIGQEYLYNSEKDKLSLGYKDTLYETED